MNTRILAAALTLFAALAFGAGAETPRKQSELLKLVHYTRELAEFRATVKHAIDERRKSMPEIPSLFWDELGREVRVDEYAQWLIALLDQMLTEQEVRALNVIVSDPKKNAALAGLLRQLSGKKGKEFADAVEKFRRSHDRRIADELIAFMKSQTAAKYGAALTEKHAGQEHVTNRLLSEAQQRVLARRK